jgi:hypothetical protein
MRTTPYSRADISVSSVAPNLSYPTAANFRFREGTNRKAGSYGTIPGKFSASSPAMNLQ